MAAKRSRAEEPEPEAFGDDAFWSFIDTAVDSVDDQLPGIDPNAMRLVMTLRRAVDFMFYDLHVELRDRRGLSAPGLRILLILYVGGRLELRQITRLAGLSRATVSAMVDTLEKQEFLVRLPSPTDRRTLLAELTDDGRRRFEEAFAGYNKREQFWASGLTKAEQKQLIGLLGKLVLNRLDAAELRRRR